MSERVYQLEFTVKYNIRHGYLICCNFIFGGKIRFFMFNVEWRRLEGKSFYLKIVSLFLQTLDLSNDTRKLFDVLTFKFSCVP